MPFHLLTKEFYALLIARLTPGGAVATNILGGTRLYLSTLVTLRAMFPTVNVYPVPEVRNETQVIAVATAVPEPGTETLMQRAIALQDQHHFRYPLPRLVTRRGAVPDLARGKLLTDDFAPVGLYETTPIRPPRGQ